MEKIEKPLNQEIVHGDKHTEIEPWVWRLSWTSIGSQEKESNRRQGELERKDDV